MAETRRMHYVPKTYLQKFAQEKNGEYYINALSKHDNRIFETNIINVCLEKDLYVLPGESEEERMFIEKMYNDLYEVGYNTLYKLLTDHTRNAITAEERYSIIGFVVSLFYRNNSWFIFYNKVIEGIFERTYNLTKHNGKDSFYFEENEISIAGKTLEELQKENKKKVHRWLL